MPTPRLALARRPAHASTKAALLLALFWLLAPGCGTTEDPSTGNESTNNFSSDVEPPRHDVGLPEDTSDDTLSQDEDTEDTEDTDDTSPSPYDHLGFPYPLGEFPPEESGPWHEFSITHGARVKIHHVVDGDTVVTAAGAESIRLLGINTPECAKHAGPTGMECDPNDTDFSHPEDAQFWNEPYGYQAFRALKDLIEIQPEVRIVCKMIENICERDAYHRTLAWIVVDTPDGPVDASHHLLEQGLALTFTKYPTPMMASYCNAEDRAIAEKRGIWQDGFDAAYAGMHPGTRIWYQHRNELCRAAQP